MRKHSETEQPWALGLPEAANLTNKDMGKLTGTSERYIRANAGILGIPRIKIGRQYRYRPSEVAAWMDAQSMGAR
ncbi:helix-turn-helix domain-containing protein [Kineococcus rhizosphaerae]|uniref:Helix-turn-helix protein n=1 Tax=Kineococcus rhizosphaerae TaxID=559628 RepID=A0A2T0QLP6_9ACTN|nr:helix-turn-helix domain-containing protein [Kineococcus rhizosphaerae]PRY05318.1 helix-turn-helix protein [Kineococcus rhizosphaerae]